MEYIPERNNQKISGLILVCLIGGFLLLAFTSVLKGLPFRWVLQLMGIGLLSGAIYLYTAYITRAFVYRVMVREDGERDLLIDEIRRKSRTTVCRISLSGIRRVEQIPSGDREKMSALKKELRKAGYRQYTYDTSFLPSSVCFLLADECGEMLAIRIPDEDGLLRMLGQEK